MRQSDSTTPGTILAAALCIVSALCFTSAQASVPVSGIIQHDTTWTAADTVMVTGDVTVQDSAKLTIQPGAVVMFDTNRGLYVDGELTVDGNAAHRTHFTSGADTVGGFPYAGEWSGIFFRPNSIGLMRYADLRYSNEAAYARRASVEFHGCAVRDFAIAGISIEGKIESSGPAISTVIDSCIVQQTISNVLGKAYGIAIYYAVSTTISDCQVTNCEYGLRFRSSGSYTPIFAVTDCEISNHSYCGIYTGG